MPLVLEKRSDVVLFFAATRHPSPHVEEISPICRRAVRLSDELGLTNQRVFFHDWIPYQERENYLLESDLGLSLHLDHVETRFAFRNRILDYIWAGLPIVASEGDTACDLVRQHRLGSVVGYEDVIGLAQAILELLAVPDLRDEMAPRFADLARNFPWERTTEPLVEFCLNPRSAPDRGVLATDVSPASIAIEARLEGLKQPMSTWAERFSKARHSLRHGGLRSLGREVANYARWKLGR
jgi:hypothetical protein